MSKRELLDKLISTEKKIFHLDSLIKIIIKYACADNETEINNQKDRLNLLLEESDELYRELVTQLEDKEEKKEADTVDYKFGSLFKEIDYDCEGLQSFVDVYILARLDAKEAVFISLIDGNRWAGSVKVKGGKSISKEEFRQVTGWQEDDFIPVERDGLTKLIDSICGDD